MKRLLFRKSLTVPTEGGGEVRYYGGHVYNVDDDTAAELKLEAITDFANPDPIAWPEGESLPGPSLPPAAPGEG